MSKTARPTALTALGLAPGEALIAGHDGARTLALIDTLMAMSDSDVMRLLAIVVADTLAPGTRLADRLGCALAADVGAQWQPDAAFLDLVRDREVTGALLAEVIGETAAQSYLTDTGRQKKQVILAALGGTGRPKVEAWTPRWLAFPQRQYTPRRLTARPAADA